MQKTKETRVWSLCRNDPLEKDMATQSNILAWEIRGQRSLVGYSSLGFRVGHDWAHTHGEIYAFTLTCSKRLSCSKIVFGKAMAPHSSTLAWKISWTEEPSRLQSMGSRRVGHDWATSLSLFTFMHWRRKWQPTPVFLPGESQGQRSLVGCRLWSHTESDTTEVT